MTNPGENGLSPWPPYPLERSDRIYDSPWVGLRRDVVKLEDGRDQELHVVEITPAVCVVPLMTDGRVAMLWQYRHPHGKTHWEVPAGRVDEGETPEEAARRELLEEAGCRAGSLERLAGFFPMNGISGHHATLFVARDCEQVAEPTPDPAERLRCVMRPWDEVRAEVVRGDYEDGFTALALLYLVARNEG